MLTVRTVVLSVALGAGGVATSSASRIDNELFEPASTAATLTVAHPALAAENTLTIKPAPAVTASTPFARRVTAQK